jgi:hypothetical protein
MTLDFVNKKLLLAIGLPLWETRPCILSVHDWEMRTRAEVNNGLLPLLTPRHSLEAHA